MSYVIIGICVLLTIVGMIWYVSLTKKSEKEEKGTENDR